MADMIGLLVRAIPCPLV